MAGPLDGISGQNQHISYGYDPSTGRLTSVTDPNGHTVTYRYDAATGNLLQSSDPNNQPLQTLTYSADGRLASVANGSSPGTAINVQPGAKQETILDPNGKLTTTVSYDDLGDVIEKDQTFNGRTVRTRAQYDAAGRMTGYVDELGNTEAWQYDESSTASNGELLSYTDQNKRTLNYTNYDQFGRATTIVGPDGVPVLVLKYDPATALLTSASQAGLPAMIFSYYSNGLLKTTTDAAGRTVTDVYDANGNKTAITDSAGNTIKLTPDAAGRVTMVQDRSGNITKYTYDGLGNLTSTTDPTGFAVSYHYNARNLLDQVSDPVHAIAYTYNGLGLVAQRTDRDGAITTYDYDSHSRLIKEVRPGNDVTNYQYDPRELLIEADNGSGELNFSYDDGARLVSQVSCAPQPNSAPCTNAAASSAQPTVQLTYAYAADGYPTAVSGPEGTTTYHYDAADNLDTVTDPAGRQFVNYYDSAHRLTSVNFPNGVTENLAYDAANSLTARDATLNGSLISKAGYTINPVTGLRDSMANLDGATQYVRQANGWLQSATYPGSSGLSNEAFTYDGAGNRTSWAGVPSSAVVLNSLEQLTSDGRFNYGYDAEGDLLAKTPAGGGAATSYRWNADHQLLEIDYPNGTVSRYRYDPLGRRIERSDPTATVRSVWDAFNVHNDYDGSNNLIASYTTLPSGPLGSDITSPSRVLEVASTSGGGYYLTDGLGSTVATTDGTGAITARYRFDSSGNPSAANGLETRYTFAGSQYDASSGLYYMHDRYYDPGTGRFLSEDPAVLKATSLSIGRWSHTYPAPDLTHPISTTLYPYAANDAVDFTDPSGDGIFSWASRGFFAAAVCVTIASATGQVTGVNGDALELCKSGMEAVSDDIEKRWEAYYARLGAEAAAEDVPGLMEGENAFRIRIIVIELYDLEG